MLKTETTFIRVADLKYVSNTNVLMPKLCSAELEIHDSVAVNAKGEKVVRVSFHPYHSSFVAPDHLRIALAKNVSKTCSKLLSTNWTRFVMETMVRGALTDSSLASQFESLETEEAYAEQHDSIQHVLYTTCVQ